MARPRNKEMLLEAAQTNFDLLEKLLTETDSAILQLPLCFEGKEAHWARDRSVKDIMIHLYEWHQLLLHWLDSNLSGDTQAFLPEPYNWRTYGAMNEGFVEKHKDTDFKEAQVLLMQSHTEVMSYIEKLSEEALFTKGYYPRSKGSTVGSYCISSTSSHYDWAIKKIKKHIKQN